MKKKNGDKGSFNFSRDDFEILGRNKIRGAVTKSKRVKKKKKKTGKRKIDKGDLL